MTTDWSSVSIMFIGVLWSHERDGGSCGRLGEKDWTWYKSRSTCQTANSSVSPLYDESKTFTEMSSSVTL